MEVSRRPCPLWAPRGLGNAGKENPSQHRQLWASLARGCLTFSFSPHISSWEKETVWRAGLRRARGFLQGGLAMEAPCPLTLTHLLSLYFVLWMIYLTLHPSANCRRGTNEPSSLSVHSSWGVSELGGCPATPLCQTNSPQQPPSLGKSQSFWASCFKGN